MNKKLTISTLFIYLLLGPICAQVVNNDTKASIMTLQNVKENFIEIRWAPSDPATWKIANELGYKVERFTLIRDSNLLDNPQRKLLTETPLKPKSLNHWEELFETDENAGIAAQAIYGEDFEVQAGSNNLLGFINKAKELESRYSFALFAASQSIEVARASGLYIKDVAIRQNEKYLYIIYVNDTVGTHNIDTGYVYVAPNKIDTVPVPPKPTVKVEQKTAMISWDPTYYENIFNSYRIERSDDGGESFQSITDEPIVGIDNENNPGNNRIYRIDSLPVADQQYIYRLRGLTLFDETSNPSDTTIIYCTVDKPVQAQIIKIEPVDDAARIHWEIYDSVEHQVQAFDIERAVKADGPFRKINKSSIDPGQRVFTDPNPLPTSYFRVVVKTKHRKTYSFPYLFQLEDSIPPEIPKNIKGQADTTGVIRLTWDLNNEADFLGYRVYRANFKKQAFVQVTSDPLPTNAFRDSINIRHLTGQVYYKITAVDNRFNESAFSEVYQVELPNLIPPTSPQFTNVTASDSNITLTWVPSSSSGVMHHLLYRSKASQDEWLLIHIHTPNDSVNRFVDHGINDQAYYRYLMIALDSSGLESKPSQIVKTRLLANGNNLPVSNLYAKVDRQDKSIRLNWIHDKAQRAQRFVLYRSVGHNPPETYKSLPATETEFIDRQVIAENTYQYFIKTIYPDGSESGYSKKVSVPY